MAIDFAVRTIEDMRRLSRLEEYYEVMTLPYLCQLSKEDLIHSLGLPRECETGYFDRKGKPKKFTYRAVCNRTPFMKYVATLLPPVLPPELTMMHVGIAMLANGYARFFLVALPNGKKYANGRYDHLDEQAQFCHYNYGRANSLWEIINLKLEYERESPGSGFMNRWAYEQISEARELHSAYQYQAHFAIAGAKARSHMYKLILQGMDPHEADLRREVYRQNLLAQHKQQYIQQLQPILERPYPGQLWLPPGAQEFKSQVQPPDGIYES